jgi:DNA-binding MarR family transcriptional regulator
MNSEQDTLSLDMLLGQVCKLHHHRAHQIFEEVGLYRGQPRLLHLLWKEEGQSHSDLARRLHVQPSTITKMIQRMEKAGFVIRQPDPDDQRVSRVYLTERGRAVRAEVREAFGHLEEDTVRGLTAEERGSLRRLLLQIRENLMEVTEEAHHPRF